MTVSREIEAEVRRLSHAEGWPPGTIAKELGVHHEVVERVLDAQHGVPKARPPRASALDPYKPFILQTLEEHPRLRAKRIYHMIRKRGFDGGARTVRRYVALVRPKPRVDAYLVCERLPGEQAQIDWGKVGMLAVPGGVRVLWVFLITLAYSRYRYAELVLDLGVESLRRSLHRAVLFFGGTPREWLFDNTKAVVIERFGDAKRLQRDLLDFAAAMHVMPRLCRPRTPTDKGGVERGIRDLKEAHFAARTIVSIERGNEELLEFIEEIVCERRHPTQPTRTVREVWEEERARLLPLPVHIPSSDLITPVAVDKTASVRLATNRYSVPSRYAGSTLTLVADDTVVRILDGATEVARHARSLGKHQRVDDLEHRRDLMEERRAANAAPVQNHLLREIPEVRIIFERWVERGRNVGAMTSRTKKLRDLYGVDLLRQAVLEMCASDTHDVGALALLCEQARRRGNLPIPLALPLPPHVVDVDVLSPDLASYDKKKGGRVVTDVVETLSALGFRASREQIHALLAHLTKSRASPMQAIEALAELERREREVRNLVSRTKKASLGTTKPSADYDWSYPKRADQAVYEELATLAFLRKKQNVLFRGPAGTGKTMLAKNLGLRALEAGLSVVFTNLSSALADLLRQESLPAVERRLRRYTSVDLLICDELGYQPIDSRAVDLLFQIISRRHDNASTIITTNLSFKDWVNVFPGAACLVPLVDRFTENLVTFDIQGDSYRQRAKPTPPAPTKPTRRPR